MEQILRKEHIAIKQYIKDHAGLGISNIDNITSNIYISGLNASLSAGNIKAHKITVVLDLSGTIKPKKTIKKYKKYNINNITISPNKPLDQLFSHVYNIIKYHTENNYRILIHCKDGLVLAPAVVIYYFLMRTYAYARIRGKKDKDVLRRISKFSGFSLMRIIKFIKSSRTCLTLDDPSIYNLLMAELYIKEDIKQSLVVESNSSTYSSSYDSTYSSSYVEYDDIASLKSLSMKIKRREKNVV